MDILTFFLTFYLNHLSYFCFHGIDTRLFLKFNIAIFNCLLSISHAVRYICSNTNLIEPNTIIFLELVTGFH